MSGHVLAPTSLDDVTRTMRDNGGELRAGGTDVTARQLTGRAAGPFIDANDEMAAFGVGEREEIT